MSESDTKNVTDSINARFIEMLEDAYYRRRVAKKVVVNEICKVVGVKDRTIYRWEKGEEIKDKYHDKIANYFNVNVNWLQTGEGPRTLNAHNLNGLGENPHSKSGATTTAKDASINEPPSSYTSQGEEIKVELDYGSWDGGVHTQIVQIPEFIDIFMFGVHVMTVRMSTPQAGSRMSIDQTKDVLRMQTIPRPAKEEPPQGNTE